LPLYRVDGHPGAQINRVAGDHSGINASSLFCLKRQTHHPVPAERRSLFLPVLKLTEKVRSARLQALFRIFCNPLAVFLENHPVFGQLTGRPVRI
jgi:hypothetical protein